MQLRRFLKNLGAECQCPRHFVAHADRLNIGNSGVRKV
jgi:hypothetical protein